MDGFDFNTTNSGKFFDWEAQVTLSGGTTGSNPYLPPSSRHLEDGDQSRPIAGPRQFYDDECNSHGNANSYLREGAGTLFNPFEYCDDSVSGSRLPLPPLDFESQFNASSTGNNFPPGFSYWAPDSAVSPTIHMNVSRNNPSLAANFNRDIDLQCWIQPGSLQAAPSQMAKQPGPSKRGA
jgi:hypothetical protein